ncbi:hypothetical protein BGZ49_002853 [Haplosporangium sp. Z 27]|nr:hypothetical protein BGZ49_002853 [Haplosporangium sp. Z 27]
MASKHQPKTKNAILLMDTADPQVQDDFEEDEETIHTEGYLSRVASYILCVVSWTRRSFSNLPSRVKLPVITFASLSVVPLACFVGFLGLACTVSLILGIIAVSVIQLGCMIFASTILFPTLGFSLLVSTAMIPLKAVASMGYRTVYAVLDFFRFKSPRTAS